MGVGISTTPPYSTKHFHAKSDGARQPRRSRTPPEGPAPFSCIHFAGPTMPRRLLANAGGSLWAGGVCSGFLHRDNFPAVFPKMCATSFFKAPNRLMLFRIALPCAAASRSKGILRPF